MDQCDDLWNGDDFEVAVPSALSVLAQLFCCPACPACPAAKLLLCGAGGYSESLLGEFALIPRGLEGLRDPS